MRFGIIGNRSWIARALDRYLTGQTVDHVVVPLEKSVLEANADLSDFDAVFLFAGRSRPTQQERMDELILVSRLPTLTRPPKKMVYISSLAVEREPTPYAQTKMACESMVLAQPWGYVLRPPVVFGPGQDPKTDMLLPQIARAVAGKEHLVIRQPFMPFHMMYVDDVCHGAWLLGAGLGTQPDRRILRLLSANDPEMTALDVVRIGAPGLHFYVMDGWTLPPRYMEYRETKPGEDKVRWSVAPQRIEQTVQHLAQVLRTGH